MKTCSNYVLDDRVQKLHVLYHGAREDWVFDPDTGETVPTSWMHELISRGWDADRDAVAAHPTAREYTLRRGPRPDRFFGRPVQSLTRSAKPKNTSQKPGFCFRR